MDEIQWLQAAAGKPHTSPNVDVTENVMRTLRERPQVQSNSMLLAVALASWALAAVSLLIAQQSISAWKDPLGDLLRL